MNKSHFIELVQEQGGYKTKAEAESAINAFAEAVSQALAKGESVSLPGFGSFASALQKSKSGKIPGTDKTYTTQDKMVPKFKAFTTFKDKLNTGR